MTDASGLQSRLDLAREAADEAGQLTLTYFRRPGLEVERKADRSPVTIADRAAEQLLRKRIAASFPDDGILGEEFAETAGRSGYRWVLDPIDGTKSFISGVPLYGTMVAVEFQGRGVAGAVSIPALGELVFAAEGAGCWYRQGDLPPQRVHVSSCSDIEDATMVTSEVSSFAEQGSPGLFEALEERTGLARTWGDCYGYLLVATGRAEIMIDPVLNVWDAAAVQPIINEAGGRFSDWSGRPSIDSGHAIGTNGTLHDQALELIARFGSLSR